MNLHLILCAFGWHSWVYAQRGQLDSRAKTRGCKHCREPLVEGFWVEDAMGQNGFFRPLIKFN